ncbi:MAG TPA: L-threonine 3-dehydrogenase [Vicinamibacteria bacterium]|nr:L-threonine 3-dehydrogenase [Vicinamibacteria bacterium]
MTGEMTAVLKPLPAPGLEVTRVPVPGLGPRDVLVKVKAASICGTDLHIVSWDKWAQGRIRPPLVFGHEFCGEVVEAGAAVTQTEVGAYVSVEGHIADGTCYQCRTGNAHICENVQIVGVDRPGCFAEYVAIPETNVYPMDPDLPREVAAIQDPYGNAVHTTLSGEVAGLSVAIVGSGPIGCCAVAVAKAAGARQVFATDIRPYRLALATRMGADRVIDTTGEDAVAVIKAETGGNGADVVLEMSGHPDGVRQAFKMLRAGGRISLLGIPSQPVTLDLAEDIIFKGATVLGINGRRMWQTWYQGQALLRSKKVDLTPLITHTLPLAEIEKGMELLRAGEAAKIILYP